MNSGQSLPKYRAKWESKIPAMCEMSGCQITNIFIDGVNRSGQWAIMCPHCHVQFGRGLGMGRGQEYAKVNGQFIKTRG